MKAKIRIEYTPAGVVCRVRRAKRVFPYSSAHNAEVTAKEWGLAQLEAGSTGEGAEK